MVGGAWVPVRQVRLDVSVLSMCAAAALELLSAKPFEFSFWHSEIWYAVASKVFDVEVHGLDVLRTKLDQHRLFGPVKEEMIAKAAKAASEKAQEASKG